MAEDASLPHGIRIGESGPDEEMIAFKHDWTDDTELRPSVMIGVAKLTDIPPEQIGPELRRSVDLGGLDRIFQPQADGTPREGGRLVLSLASCEITIYSDGWVEAMRTTD